jgi:protein-disulfide isomerase
LRKQSYFAVFIFLLMFSLPGFSQQTENRNELEDLKKEINSLKEGQARIEKALQEIRSLLQARPAPTVSLSDVVLNLANEPVLGDKNAKLTIVEFSDYQ